MLLLCSPISERLITSLVQLKARFFQSIRSAVIADITHEIPPQDIEAGAFTLLACLPDVSGGNDSCGGCRSGSRISAPADRRECQRAVLCWTRQRDLQLHLRSRAFTSKSFHITAEKYFRPSPSSTFHGRDIFAPVAAALSNGVKPEELGPGD